MINFFFISVPLYVIGIIELQFIACLQLIRNRLAMINNILISFRKTFDIQNHSNGNSFGYDFTIFHENEFPSQKLFNRTSKHNRIDMKNVVNPIELFNEKSAIKTESSNDKIINQNECYWTFDDGSCQFSFIDFTEHIIQIHQIYTKLERITIIFKSAYSIHLIVILIMKFTTLTSLLYFCCMIIIKLRIQWVFAFSKIQ